MFESISQNKENKYVKSNELNIVNILGKENLENIQQKISKATGLAFVTVDYKGTPVTECTFFTEFCQTIRCDKFAEKVCMSSDAFGGIQAAVTQKPYVYFCPCGLLEIAIPIIIHGNYLGGFIGGQIRCLDAPKETSNLGTILRHNKDYKNHEEMSKLYNSINVIKYQQFMDFAELIFLIINQLGEKEMSKLIEKEYLNKEIDSLNDKRKRMELESNLKNTELIALRSKMNPYFLLRSLNSISNLAIIEDAPKTNEMIIMLSDFFKHNLVESKNIVFIHEEMNNVERYLKIQNIRLGEALSYTISIDKDTYHAKIPCFTILPFVERAIFYGIFQKKDNGILDISVKKQKGFILIEIFDNGPIKKEHYNHKFKIYNEDYEDVSIEEGISIAMQRLVNCYGGRFEVETINIEGQGTKSIIKCPENFYERVV